MALSTWICVLTLLGTSITCLDVSEWQDRGRDALADALRFKLNTNVAKNVILFLGDGLGITTTTVARIYKGQKAGEVGEMASFSFQNLPNVGLSKTFSNDRQVTESGAGANAILAGTKINSGTLGVNTRTVRTDCSTVAGNEISGLVNWSMDEGKWTGIVTTTRVTHATPAASYAHSAERKWECDADQPPEIRDTCKDTAYQLIMNNTGINVIMGGGRTKLLPNTVTDPEYTAGTTGSRLDGLDLTEEWKKEKNSRNVSNAYVWNQAQFDAVDPANTDYLLGLFEPNHMLYTVDRDSAPYKEPSLAEMTAKAIGILERQEKGYFLLVEGGRIDHAHHLNLPKLAVEETLAFDDAVAKGLELTNEEDTLIIVTSDHAHPFSMGSWTSLNTPILGFVDKVGFDNEPSTDGLPYTSLSYGNGPGRLLRDDLTNIDTETNSFKFPVNIPLKEDTHGGQDVAIYARGPMSHLISSTRENQYIAHVMAYASCVGTNKDHCLDRHDAGDNVVDDKPLCSAGAFRIWEGRAGVTIILTFTTTIGLIRRIY